jgi:hypothetical protein
MDSRLSVGLGYIQHIRHVNRSGSNNGTWKCHANDTYNVARADPSLFPAKSTITATCHDVDGSGVPFQMAYTINYYSHHVSGGDGKGGGGAGTVNVVTSATVTITQ